MEEVQEETLGLERRHGCMRVHCKPRAAMIASQVFFFVHVPGAPKVEEMRV